MRGLQEPCRAQSRTGGAGQASASAEAEGGRRSLRAISAELAAQGFLNENGRAFAATSVKSMLA
jgi:hypothetical protein